jgi:hypothetical protein
VLSLIGSAEIGGPRSPVQSPMEFSMDQSDDLDSAIANGIANGRFSHISAVGVFEASEGTPC